LEKEHLLRHCSPSQANLEMLDVKDMDHETSQGLAEGTRDSSGEKSGFE